MRGDRGVAATIRVCCVATPERSAHLEDLLEAGPVDLSVQTLSSRSAALETLESVDCIVADTDQFEILSAVHERAPDLPVILTTPEGDVPFVNDALAAGATDVVETEPDSPGALARRIVVAVRRREETRRYQSLVENLPGLLYRTTDEEGWPYVFVDGECAAVTGYTATELLEDVGSADELIHPDDIEHVERTSRAQIERGEPFEVTYRVRRRDGEIRWIWERGRKTNDGLLEGFLTDITDRIEHERDLERYRTIVEASGDAMYTLDAAGHLTLVNDSFVEMTGYDRADLVGEHIELVMTDEHVERGEDLIRSLLNADEQQGMFEMDVITAGGEAIPCENHMVLLPFEEDFRGTAGVLRDITERKRREEALERERDRLEQFASVISHDLRNPLTVAQGYLDIAQTTDDPEAFDHIDKSLDRMERIIQDVLWLAREGRDIKETTRLDLEAVVEEAWSHVAANRSGVTLSVSDVGTLEADEDRLCQLLENLFRNAIEHGGTDVTVRVESLLDGFAVADDGPGIPEDKRDVVFEQGYTSSPDGTGLGLHIVKEIATAHDWTITLEESTEGGARFRFQTRT